MRTIDELIDSGLTVLDRAYCGGALQVRPLLSGGHDSMCAVHLASQHRGFQHEVHHIDTGIGSQYTRQFVERFCDRFGWKLCVHKSKEPYEKIVREHGFPGPGGHQYVYNRLKDRCVYKITKGSRANVNATMLVNGSRSEESVRRMGHVAPVQVGELIKKGPRKGKRRNPNRVWTAPCHDWTKAEQLLYMYEMGLPTNKVKVAVGISGECFCGAFAQSGEIDAIREYVPDVASEIDRLTVIAAECGKPCIWGQRPTENTVIAETGPLCSGCDRRAAAAGIVTIG